MTQEFKNAKRKRMRRIRRWQNGSTRQRKLARKLQSCRRHRRRGLPECPVCELLQRRKTRRQHLPSIIPQADPAMPDGLTTCASEIAPEAIEWLWPGRIPLGKVSVIAGDPGVGKSQLVALLAATVSKGENWPFQEGKAPLGSVIMLNGEDDAGDTVRPRLEVAGADLTRIRLIEGHRFDLTSDADLLEKEIWRFPDARLIVIDPISAFLKSTSAQRTAAKLLQECAKKTGVAVVVVSHLTKTVRSTALNQVIGSLGLVAMARAVYVVTHEVGSDRRLFLPAKTNLSNHRIGLAYRTEGRVTRGGIKGSAIVWDAPITISADDALASRSAARKQPARTDAEDFLIAVLGAGPVPAKKVMSEASDAGISGASLRRAADYLGVKRRRTGGFAGDGQWFWELPSEHAPAGKAAPKTPQSLMRSPSG